METKVPLKLSPELEKMKNMSYDEYILNKKIHDSEADKFISLNAKEKALTHQKLIHETNWCELRAIENLCIKAYEARYMKNPELCKKYNDILKENDQMALEYEIQDTWYICVNPMPGISECEFYDYCERAIHKKWIKYAVCWFEWTQNKNRPCHANIAITHSKQSMSRVKDQFYSTFKKFIGDEKAIKIQRATRGEFKKILRYRYEEGKPWVSDRDKSEELFGTKQILNHIEEKSYEISEPIFIKHGSKNKNNKLNKF